MISIVIPAYKEMDNLVVLLPKIKSALSKLNTDYEVIIVDTVESMDDTEQVCKSFEFVKYCHRFGGNSYGDAIRSGISLSKGEYILIMDADGSHNPLDIIKMYSKMTTGKYDLIIGSRYCKGAHTENGFISVLMSRMLNATYRIAFGITAKDISNSFKLYKAEQLKSIDLVCENFDIVEEILVKLILNIKDFSIKEVPVVFNQRIYGESKRDLVKFILSYLNTIKNLLKYKYF